MDATDRKGKVLFTQAHGERLRIGAEPEAESETFELYNLLEGLGFEPASLDEPLTTSCLEGARVVVVGAPNDGLSDSEVENIRHFVEQGGGLLLVTNSAAIGSSGIDLNDLAQMAGLEFREYLNYPPFLVELFSPHYITANVHRIDVKNVAHLICSEGARALAFTKTTRSIVVACGTCGRGRVVALGDVALLLSDLLVSEGNRALVTNTFYWLATENVIDIEQLVVPETVKWGQCADVVLTLSNGVSDKRPQVECILESDVDALIAEQARKTRSIPPGMTTEMRWKVKPQILGKQKLRLAMCVEGQPPLYFDRMFPQMSCEAPGYLRIQIQGTDGELKTEFQTGDYFNVDGSLHWPAGLEPPDYRLKLKLDKGLVERGYQAGEGIDRWRVQAAAPGTHTLALSIAETHQTYLAEVTVKLSIDDQIRELQAAHISPLDAEIAERLHLVDPRLSNNLVRNQPFYVLPSDQYIGKVYDADAGYWLKGVLKAARQEQWYNLELLNHVLVYLAPVYLPTRGSFVPYDPVLVSHLIDLHPTARWRLEYNFLRSEDSEDMNVRQNVAAYLLHEKYGHGFFYANTRLGRQLSRLERLRGELGGTDALLEAIEVIEDSALIVNEGFAAWMELTFLGDLDREVRQALYPRRVFLLEHATRLHEKQTDNLYFQEFPPRFDSPYREGFEYLDFISRNFDRRCAVRILLIVTNIDLGISTEDELLESSIIDAKQRLLSLAHGDIRSQDRLRAISELLYERRDELQEHLRNRHCPHDCSSSCVLEEIIDIRLGWRRES